MPPRRKAATTSLKSEIMPLRSEEDILLVRQAVRAWMVEQRFGLIDQTKMVTATSELARNAVVYGGGGTARLELLEEHDRRGLWVRFEDQGPGIANLAQAMTDGFTTGGGLGLGLGGSKRLVDDFEIESAPGQGTRVMITRWQ